jgi:hypothetical protein
MRASGLVIFLLLNGPLAGAQSVVDTVSTAPGREALPCVPAAKQACTYTDGTGANVYTVDTVRLSRAHEQRPTYSVALAGRGAKILGVAMNQPRSQVVIAMEWSGSTSTIALERAAPPPDAFPQQYWLSIRNPKTGQEIKAIGLGLFKPSTFAVTPVGDYVWMIGDEMPRGGRHLRCYNTRSGRREFEEPLERGAAVRLFESGFQRGTIYYSLGRNRTYNSPDGYSIGEFTVVKKDGQPGLREIVGSEAIAVIGFNDLEPSRRNILDPVLISRVRAAGFRVTERNRLTLIADELLLQSEVTDPATRQTLGHITNARHLLVGQLSRGPALTTITLQTLAAESADVGAVIELQCRDCTEDDYVQALTYLVKEWTE